MTLFTAHGHLIPLERFRQALRNNADPCKLWKGGNDTHYDVQSPLLLAATSVDGLGYVRALLEYARTDLAQTDLQGRTALHLATACGNVDAVRCLIRAGANIHAVDTYGQTPLLYACQGVDDKPMRLLLEAGSDPNVMNQNGRAALHETLMAYTTDPAPLEAKVALLLTYGAHASQAGWNGITPLYAAASAGWARLVTLLLSYGADPRQAADNGERPIDAVRRGLLMPGQKQRALIATQNVLLSHDRKRLQRVALTSMAQLPAWQPLVPRM